MYLVSYSPLDNPVIYHDPYLTEERLSHEGLSSDVPKVAKWQSCHLNPVLLTWVQCSLLPLCLTEGKAQGKPPLTNVNQPTSLAG